MSAPAVEVVAYVKFAANDEAVDLVAFLDGVQVPIRKVVVDPGSGHNTADWRAARDRAAAAASPACAELIREWFEDGEGHVNVHDDHPRAGAA